MSVAKSNISKSKFLTTNRKINGKNSALKAHQVQVYNHRKKIVTDVMTPSPNENSLTNATQLKYFIENGAVTEISSLVLRFQIRMDTGDATLAPVPYWFDRIEIYDRHTGQELARYHDDILHLMINTVHTANTDQWAKLVNYDKDSLKLGEVQLQNTTRYYYLPLVASLFEGAGIDMSIVKNDIEIRLHPRNPVSSGTGVPALTEVASVITVENEDVTSRRSRLSFHNSFVSSHQFINSQQYTLVSQTLNAGNKYSWDLDQFDHVSAGLFVAIRPTGATNAGNGRQNYQDVYDTTVDVVGTSGVSIYSAGRPIDANYVSRIEAPKYVGSRYFDKIKVTPLVFGSLSKALHGAVDGYIRFVGDKNRLEFDITSTAGVNSTNTFTTSTAPTAGSYKFCYKGVYSANLAFNATPAQMKTALEAMSSIIDADVTATFNVALNDAGNVSVATLVRPNGQPVILEENIEVIPLSTLSDGVNQVDVTATRTDGTNGWVSGVYDIDIYSLYFRTLHQDRGKLAVEDL